ncbi:MAG: hypothetical protein FJ290_21225 [Planctomycetes bacterium]|nr:hypothetical protein [Planctomycetota bacterium]
MPDQAPHARPRDRRAARAAERRRRLWFNLASWGTTIAIVVAVGLLVHWRVTSVLDEDRREKQAEVEFQDALRAYRSAPADPGRVAARLRALIAAHPGTEAARKAQAELAKVEGAGKAQDSRGP